MRLSICLKRFFLVYVLKWGADFMCLKPKVNYKEPFAEFEEQEKRIWERAVLAYEKR